MGKRNIVLNNKLDVFVECPSATKDRGTSVIRGWRENDYILMDIPKFKHPFPLNTYHQATWLIRYVHEGEVIGFRVKGRESISSCNIFALDYPNKIETLVLRKQLRAALNMPVRFHTSSDPETSLKYKGMSTDISLGGIKIKLSEKVKKSDSYFITLYLPMGGTVNYMQCEILKSVYGQRSCELGLKFINVSKEHEKAINSCIQQFSDVLDTEEDLFPV